MIAFSANKFYGPTGLGALIVKKSILDNLQPVTFGG
ncbi:aminotransferase class V-fold PLP-dependent enzyme, partial [Mycoplasmopsis bovis]